MSVPFVDIGAQNASIREELDAAIGEVIDRSAFAAGPFVAAFERDFAKAHGAAHCAAVSNGTAALHAALWALGVGPGDEVVVPVNTFIATAEAVSLSGARPVFVDCDDRYYAMDPERLDSAITGKTKAIVAVHLYGQPAWLDRVAAIAKDRGVHLVEDCAQAHLAEYGGTPVGTVGICGCFSFYPGKNLGALGEGGAVVTNDPDLHARIQAIKDHGMLRKYHHDVLGHNYRMEGLQGAVLSVKLKRLDEWTEGRRRCAKLYGERLVDVPDLLCPQEHPQARHVWHLFVVRLKRRDELLQFLRDRDIGAGIHYPIPCHLQPAYAFLGHGPGDFPVAERCGAEVLSLPMFAELTDEQITEVAAAIQEFCHAPATPRP